MRKTSLPPHRSGVGCFRLLRQKARSEKGSMTVLTTLLIALVCLTSVVMSDIGQLVFEKMRLQHATDAAALAAATVQSAGLNEIAGLNFEIADQYSKLVMILLKGFPWDSINQGTKAIKFFKNEFDYLRDLQDDANDNYGDWAVEIAEKTIDANTPADRTWDYTIDADQPMMEFSDPQMMPAFFMWIQYFYYAPTWTTTMWNDAMAEPKEAYGEHDGSYRGGSKRGIPIPYLEMVETWRSKEGEVTDVEVSISQAPADYMVGIDILGRMPQLMAHAKVKPAGGHIEHFMPEYRPYMLE